MIFYNKISTLSFIKKFCAVENCDYFNSSNVSCCKYLPAKSCGKNWLDSKGIIKSEIAIYLMTDSCYSP